MLSGLLRRGKKIVGVGKNYALHISEMGGKAPKDPVLFLKPTTSYVFEPSPITLSPRMGEVHHEVELAVVIGDKGAKRVPTSEAIDCIGGYAVAIDLTARDLQASAKKEGLPWAVAKGWDGFCPIGSVVPKGAIRDPDDVALWLKVNGETRQQSNTRHMIRNTATLISYISGIFTLEPGDVILTGTPEGVGPIRPGDVVEAGLTGVTEVKFRVEAEHQ